jgi:hypothetical protein
MLGEMIAVSDDDCTPDSDDDMIAKDDDDIEIAAPLPVSVNEALAAQKASKNDGGVELVRYDDTFNRKDATIASRPSWEPPDNQKIVPSHSKPALKFALHNVPAPPTEEVQSIPSSISSTFPEPLQVNQQQQQPDNIDYLSTGIISTEQQPNVISVLGAMIDPTQQQQQQTPMVVPRGYAPASANVAQVKAHQIIPRVELLSKFKNEMSLFLNRFVPDTDVFGYELPDPAMATVYCMMRTTMLDVSDAIMHTNAMALDQKDNTVQTVSLGLGGMDREWVSVAEQISCEQFASRLRHIVFSKPMISKNAAELFLGRAMPDELRCKGRPGRAVCKNKHGAIVLKNFDICPSLLPGLDRCQCKLTKYCEDCYGPSVAPKLADSL